MAPSICGFPTTICKTVCPMLSHHCLSVCPVCNVGILWPNGWMDQHETWHGGRPRHQPHCVRRGPSSPSPKGTQPPSPNIRPTSVVAKWLDGLKCHLVWSRPQPGEFVLDGDPAPSPQKGGGAPTTFGPCLLC